MDEPLGAVEFLARSENRVRALSALSTDPYGRNDLADVLGVSRITATRLLDEFIDYGWVTVDHEQYRTTELGRVASESFQSLLDTFETIQRLAMVLPYSPPDFDIDLRRLIGASVTLPTLSDPLAPVRRSTELMRDADEVRGLGTGIAPEALRANRDAVLDGQSLEVIFSHEVMNVVTTDPALAHLLREILDAGASVHSHECIDLLTARFDRSLVVLGIADESGMPRGLIESHDEVVGDWFETIFGQYRDEAEPVSSTQFDV